MKIENKTQWFFPVKMKSVNTNARPNIKKQFFEGNIIFELEILLKFFRFKN